jgi:hypothetical protein
MVSLSPRGRCVGLSSAATAAEDNHVEVDDGVKSLLSSAPPPHPRQKIRGQKQHAAEALGDRPSIVSVAAMVAGGDDGLPWRLAGRQWLIESISSAHFDCYVTRSRENRSVSVFPHKKSMVAANSEDSSDDTAFTMILVTPPRCHNRRYLMA